jgi:predicted DNA-binding protein (MmcQ/YjbR family)
MAAKNWTHAKHPIAKALRVAALGYPETVEDFPWEHPAYKAAGKKVFLFLGGNPDALSLSMKLPFRREEALLAKNASPTAYGLGKAGWVTFTFPLSKGTAALPKLLDYLDESWRAVAPKKLSAAHPAPPAAAKRRKA